MLSGPRRTPRAACGWCSSQARTQEIEDTLVLVLDYVYRQYAGLRRTSALSRAWRSKSILFVLAHLDKDHAGGRAKVVPAKVLGGDREVNLARVLIDPLDERVRDVESPVHDYPALHPHPPGHRIEPRDGAHVVIDEGGNDAHARGDQPPELIHVRAGHH